MLRSERATSAAVIVALLAMGGTCQGFGRIGLAFILPGIRHDLAGSYAAVGVLLTVSYVGYTGGCIAFRVLARRLVDRTIVRIGLAGQVLAFVLIAGAPSYAVEFVGMLVSGVSCAFVWLAITGLLNVHAPSRWRNVIFGGAMSMTGLFVAVSGWLLAVLPSGSGGPAPWRLLVLCQCAVAVVCLASSFLLPFAGSSSEPVAAADGTTGGAIADPEVGANTAVRSLTGAFFLFGATQVLFLNFFVAAVDAETGFSAAQASGIYSLLGVASLVGGLSGGRAIDFFGAWACLLACMVTLIACALAMVSRSELLIPPAALLFGAAITAVGAGSVAYLADTVPARELSSGYAMITMGLGLGQVVSPFLGGWLIDVTGSFVSSYLVCTVSAVGAALLVARLPTRSRRALREV